MKILFVISTLNAGGAERALSILANYFCKFHEVDILKFNSADSFYEINPKINIISCPYFMYKKHTLSQNLIRRIKKFLFQTNVMRGRYDLVISFMDTTNILTIFSNLFARKKLIICEHSSYAKLPFFWNTLRRLSYPFANYLTILTRNDFEKFTFVKNKCIMKNPMFDLSGYKQDFNKDNLIIFIGRLVHIKDPMNFILAISKISKDILQDWHIKIIGNGNLKEQCENLSKKLRLNIEFINNTDNIQMYYNKAKVIVNSSKSEGLPNVLVESIFFNVARIATPTNGAKELITHEFDGLLCKDFSSDSLAKTIKYLLTNKDLIVRFTENASMKKDDFLIENIYDRWCEIFKEIGL